MFWVDQTPSKNIKFNKKYSVYTDSNTATRKNSSEKFFSCIFWNESELSSPLCQSSFWSIQLLLHVLLLWRTYKCVRQRFLKEAIYILGDMSDDNVSSNNGHSMRIILFPFSFRQISDSSPINDTQMFMYSWHPREYELKDYFSKSESVINEGFHCWW